MASAGSLQQRVGRRMRELRMTAGLSQDAVATRLGIALKNYQRMESGTQNLTLATIERVAYALGVEAVDLLVREATDAPTRGRPRRAGADLLAGLAEAGLTVVEADEPRAVRVLSLEASAGLLDDPRDVEALAYVLVPSRARLDARHCFVARVVGSSMAPEIEDGAYVLFRVPARRPFGRKVLLVRVRDRAGDRFLVKRVTSFARRDGVVRATLASANDAYAPIVVEARDPEAVLPIAELVKVFPARPR